MLCSNATCVGAGLSQAQLDTDRLSRTEINIFFLQYIYILYKFRDHIFQKSVSVAHSGRGNGVQGKTVSQFRYEKKLDICKY